METISDKLFLKMSSILGIRVTKDNLRQKLIILQKDGIYNQKMKNEMIVELIMAIAELEEKIDELNPKDK